MSTRYTSGWRDSTAFPVATTLISFYMAAIRLLKLSWRFFAHGVLDDETGRNHALVRTENQDMIWSNVQESAVMPFILKYIGHESQGKQSKSKLDLGHNGL
jgi:hypothetical protein